MPRRLLPVLAAAAVALVGCASSSSAPVAAPLSGGASCGGAPVQVVVSVDQWGDIVKQLGGACATTTSIFASSSADPHDYEPTPADATKFAGAKIVVVNGVDYDPWAIKLSESQSPQPKLIDGGVVVGVAEGENPHLWHSPTFVFAIANAVTAALKSAEPASAEYFDAQATAWRTSMKPYEDLIAAIKDQATVKSYASTESVFDYMADEVGLVNKTPTGWAQAAANESDPSPADLAEFNNLLSSKGVDVLVYNTQTEADITAAVLETAKNANVPYANVTESVPPGVTSFVDWQVTQLEDLAQALGVSG